MSNINKTFLCLALLAAINAAAASILSNITLGTILTWFLSMVLLLCSFRSGIAASRPAKAAKYTLLGIFCLLLAGSMVLYVGGGRDTAAYDEDAVIVLGTGVRGEEPTESLRRRLDAAIRYHENNPDAMIVVTGGQGSDENITEALCMERYLLKAGIPQEIIIKEDQATSTEENFMFSQKILDDLLAPGYKTCYISNDFHIFRAGLYARSFGFPDATHASGTTPWYMIVPNGLRETVVICKTFILG